MSPAQTTFSLEDAVGQRILMAFQGKDGLPQEVRQAIRKYRPAGFTLFRSLNLERPEQVRQLTQTLQKAATAHGLPPFIIATDQEGGQLMAIGDGATPLPGNMSLGAADSADLARQAGEVLGRELSAMGVNVDYAPSCDVNINPYNPVIGTRSFGEDPRSVAELSAAMIQGIQNHGVAATAKHFPGHGDTASDSHHGIPVVPHSRERLNQVELPPFSAAIQADVKLVMSAHLSLPAIDGRDDLPATLSPRILGDLLRNELGFGGVIVTDAMDMKAIRQGEGLGEEAVAAATAGADLLLLTAETSDHSHVYEGLLEAAQSGRLKRPDLYASVGRIMVLKEWLAAQSPALDLSVVGCTDHRVIADEIAQRSITLVRDQAHLLPLRPNEDQRLAVILPHPLDLTPADTSSYVQHTLAPMMRAFHPHVDEFIVPHAPQEQDIAAIVERILDYQVVIMGTINAFTQPGQAALVQAVLNTGIPTIVVAMRMPYDLVEFPAAPTYLCSYGVLEPSMRALARVLSGETSPSGRLPVSIPGLYTLRHSQDF